MQHGAAATAAAAAAEAATKGPADWTCFECLLQDLVQGSEVWAPRQSY